MQGCKLLLGSSFWLNLRLLLLITFSRIGFCVSWIYFWSKPSWSSLISCVTMLLHPAIKGSLALQRWQLLGLFGFVIWMVLFSSFPQEPKLDASSGFYKEMSLEFNQQQIAIDVFAFGVQPLDLATTSKFLCVVKCSIFYSCAMYIRHSATLPGLFNLHS